MRNKLFKDLINYAYDKVPYYREKFDDCGVNISEVTSIEDIGQLPFLKKDIIQGNYKKMLSTDYFYPPGRDTLITQRTSGSTGQILKVEWNKYDFIRSLFYLWILRSRFYGIDASSKYCSFYSTLYRGNKLVENIPEINASNNGKNISFSKMILDDEHLYKYLKKMHEFKPEWLFLQPSVAYILADFIDRNSLKVPETLKYIELTGEYLFDEFRKKILEVFRVPVANMYGCMEANGIALECKNGHMHLLNNNVAVEILNGGNTVGYGREGEIFITSLYNKAMPFIRYALGDRVVLSPAEKCGCGLQSDILEVIAGRVNDFVIVEGREPISSYLFVYSLESINVKLGYPVKQFQIIQESKDNFTANLSLHNRYAGWKETVKKEFLLEMSKLRLDKMNWNIQFHDVIMPTGNTGKLQFFINRVKEKVV